MMSKLDEGCVYATVLNTPLRELNVSQRYSIWRYFVHLADWAGHSESYLAELKAIDIQSLPEDTAILFKAVVCDSKCALAYLTETQLADLRKLNICDPALSLTEDEPILAHYRAFGFLI